VHSNQAEVQKIIEKWLIRAKDKVIRNETVAQRSNNEYTHKTVAQYSSNENNETVAQYSNNENTEDIVLFLSNN